MAKKRYVKYSLRQADNWPDIYSISGNMGAYLHTNPENFYIQASKHLGGIRDAYKSFNKVLKVILDDHIKHWTVLQEKIIDKALKDNLINKKMNPEEFLKVYNEKFQEFLDTTQGEGVKTMLEWKGMTRKYATNQQGLREAQKGKRKKPVEWYAKKYTKFVAENWGRMLEIIVYVLNSQVRFEKKWADFITGEDYNFNDVMPNFAGAQKSIENILNFLGLIDGELPKNGKALEKVLKGLKEKMKKYAKDIKPLDENGKVPSDDIISKFFTLNTRTQLGYFLNDSDSALGGMLSSMGRYFEDIYTEGKVSSPIYGNDVSGESLEDLTKKNVGHKAGRKTRTDVIEMGIKYNERKINVGTSLKLTRFPGITQKEYTTVDLVEKGTYLKSILSSDSVSVNPIFIKQIKWLRNNLNAASMASIQAFDAPEFSANDFKFYERNLAGLSTIPKLLDSIYTYQEKNIEDRPDGEGIYFTAFINIEDKFYWTADILKAIADSISPNKFFTKSSRIVHFSTGQEATFNITKGELWKLWSEKRRVIKALIADPDEKLSYEAIYGKMAKDFNTIYEDSRMSASPYKSVITDLKLGFLKQDRAIK